MPSHKDCSIPITIFQIFFCWLVGNPWWWWWWWWWCLFLLASWEFIQWFHSSKTFPAVARSFSGILWMDPMKTPWGLSAEKLRGQMSTYETLPMVFETCLRFIFFCLKIGLVTQRSTFWRHFFLLRSSMALRWELPVASCNRYPKMLWRGSFFACKPWLR